ncbi:MAG: hypothetical protein MRY21_04895 [Simkaniaceae bacterium]|nr:hypothetical protein [Simkaniaceae bacterium]
MEALKIETTLGDQGCRMRSGTETSEAIGSPIRVPEGGPYERVSFFVQPNHVYETTFLTFPALIHRFVRSSMLVDLRRFIPTITKRELHQLRDRVSATAERPTLVTGLPWTVIALKYCVLLIRNEQVDRAAGRVFHDAISIPLPFKSGGARQVTLVERKAGDPSMVPEFQIARVVSESTVHLLRPKGVFDVSGREFFVQTGKTLREVLQGEVTVDQGLSLMNQLVLAVKEMYAQSYLHLGISQTSVRVDKGRVELGGFWLARKQTDYQANRERLIKREARFFGISSQLPTPITNFLDVECEIPVANEHLYRLAGVFDGYCQSVEAKERNAASFLEHIAGTGFEIDMGIEDVSSCLFENDGGLREESGFSAQLALKGIHFRTPFELQQRARCVRRYILDRVIPSDPASVTVGSIEVDGSGGFINYVAPEVERRGDATERADIYALGKLFNLIKISLERRGPLAMAWKVQFNLLISGMLSPKESRYWIEKIEERLATLEATKAAAYLSA